MRTRYCCYTEKGDRSRIYFGDKKYAIKIKKTFEISIVLCYNIKYNAEQVHFPPLFMLCFRFVLLDFELNLRL